MKKNIHPLYKKIKIKFDKDEIYTRSTLNIDTIFIDVDYRNHPAWSKKRSNFINKSTKSVVNFNKKFGNIAF